jgi:hypothetical protein
MKQPSPAKPKFEGGLKHYHRRSGVQRRVGWDEWAESHSKRRHYPWGKILLVTLSLLVLGIIIAGLAIELAPN